MIYHDLTYFQAVNWDKPRDSHGQCSSTGAGEYYRKFSGTGSLEEARRIAREGWDAGIEALENICTPEHLSQVALPAVAGGRVNVGAFCSGNPLAMVQFVDDEGDRAPLPQLSVYLYLNLVASVSVESAIERAKKQLSEVAALAKSNDLEIFLITARGDKRGKGKKGGAIKIVELTRVKIKAFGSSFALNSFAFAVHPAFLRRIMFRIWESTPDLPDYYGYGVQRDKVERALANLEKSGKIAGTPRVIL